MELAKLPFIKLKRELIKAGLDEKELDDCMSKERCLLLAKNAGLLEGIPADTQEDNVQTQKEASRRIKAHMEGAIRTDRHRPYIQKQTDKRALTLSLSHTQSHTHHAYVHTTVTWRSNPNSQVFTW